MKALEGPAPRPITSPSSLLDLHASSLGFGHIDSFHFGRRLRSCHRGELHRWRTLSSGGELVGLMIRLTVQLKKSLANMSCVHWSAAAFIMWREQIRHVSAQSSQFHYSCYGMYSLCLASCGEHNTASGFQYSTATVLNIRAANLPSARVVNEKPCYRHLPPRFPSLS